MANCTFLRMDGTVVFLSGYVRNASVTGSEFAWVGATAIALWGYGDGGPVPGMGPDLTAGNQPRHTTVLVPLVPLVPSVLTGPTGQTGPNGPTCPRQHPSGRVWRQQSMCASRMSLTTGGQYVCHVSE